MSSQKARRVQTSPTFRRINPHPVYMERPAVKARVSIKSSAIMHPLMLLSSHVLLCAEVDG